MKPAVVRKQSAASRKAAHRAATEKVNAWYASHGWEPFPFQRRTWQAYLDGQSGLIHAVTGTGKTQAAWFGPVIEAIAEQAVSNGITGTQPLPLIDEPQLSEAPVLKKGRGGKQKRLQEPPLRVLWITPLRALAADTARALAEPLTDCGLMWTVETRTGDTIAATKRQQQTQLPTALVTTPESLSLLLTRNDTQHQMRDLRMVVVDEWHELLGTKRGVQTELALARLRRWFPSLRVWGLSATLGNTDFAGQVLMGAQSDPAKTTVISGGHRKQTIIRTLIPNEIERLPWAGHLGLKLLPEVIEGIDQAGSSLVFTNTRYQAEQWYQSILQSKPEWAGQIALHHGSLDPSVRKWVEQALRDQKLKCVVCTSSLDLGVDFTPVQRVFQVGSPKGIARMLQRAGRSGHQPGATSEIVAVPTNAFELVEVAAARDAMQARQIESRVALVAPLDVLVQHAVTISIGTGFQRDELLSEVRTSHAYQSLTEMDWVGCSTL